MSFRPVITRRMWNGKPCRDCGDQAEVGENYCRGCLRDRREAAKHAASHSEKGAS